MRYRRAATIILPAATAEMAILIVAVFSSRLSRYTSPWVDPRTSNTAKAEFKTAWKALKARTTPEQLLAAYEAMNTRDDG